MIEGAVDLVTVEKAVGWLSDRKSKEKFDVVATLDGGIVGEGAANLSRPDLKEAGFGDGMCGFDVGFFNKLTEADLLSVTLSPKGSALIIPRTTTDSYVDAFRFLTARYPQAGRSRSVYGGLWTDRTDALHLLAGRVNTGACDRALLPDLRAFIGGGLVQIETAAAEKPPASALAALADAASAVAKVKEAVLALAPLHLTAQIADLLKAIFDDVPVAYRPTVIAQTQATYSQANAFEAFSSPAEVVACYFLAGGEGARLDYVLDSHELPEFGPGGVSRWTMEGATVLPIIAAGSQRAVRSCVLRNGMCVFLGPGVVHRIAVPAGASVVRIIFSPKRVTPLRFLQSGSWIDLDMGLNIRARL